MNSPQPATTHGESDFSSSSPPSHPSPFLPTHSFGTFRDSTLQDLATELLFTRIRDDLAKLNKGKLNNIQDALIAETAINNGLVLVTEDRDLRIVVSREGGSATRIQDINPSGPNNPPV